jgi:hypothetical protein
VESHCTSNLSEEQLLNMEAHQLAISCLKSTPNCARARGDLLSQIVTVLSKRKMIAAGLPQQIFTNIHYEPLKDKILKYKGWNQTTFNLVDWVNFHKAIISVPRLHRMSITKLSQGLWNTNVQNEKFYGNLNTCPYCPIKKETIEHIFCCNHEIAKQERDTALTAYKVMLISKRTPPQLVETIVAGITTGIAQSLSQNSDHPALEHQVGREQGATLGWVVFLQGYISQKWKDSYQAMISGKKSVQDSQTWAKNLILANWTYSKSIWASRNAVVHGKGAMEMEGKTITPLKRRIRELYLMLQKD